jgi:hypothetical protein
MPPPCWVARSMKGATSAWIELWIAPESRRQSRGSAFRDAGRKGRRDRSRTASGGGGKILGHGKLSFAVRCWEPGVTLSLGDCVCLTMAAWLRAVAVMADHRWQELDGAVVNDATIRVELIR